jgi:hypothetical protein
MSSLTSVNAAMALAIPLVFPVPQNISGWSADDAFTTDVLELAETVMGIDGQFHAGYVINPYKMNLTIMPDVDTANFFAVWQQYMQTTKEVAQANGSIILKAVNGKYVLSQGYLTSASPIPDVKKILQPLKFQITWGSILKVPTA